MKNRRNNTLNSPMATFTDGLKLAKKAKWNGEEKLTA